jgi:hypothetical protein
MKLFTSCDSKYLRVHAPALVASAAASDNSIHINVCGAQGDDVDFLDHLSSRYHKIAGWPQSEFTWSMSTPFINVEQDRNPDAKRTMYACDRFVTIVDLMALNPEEDYLIIDTDCLIMKHIEKPGDDQVGLFLREPLPGTVGWENAGSRVAAGVVYYSHESIAFARQVMRRIKQGPMAWFLDQVAINETYEKELSNYRFHYFDAQFMDWEFIDGTTIWTGKGPRKYENPTYLTKKNHFDRMIR